MTAATSNQTRYTLCVEQNGGGVAEVLIRKSIPQGIDGTIFGPEILPDDPHEWWKWADANGFRTIDLTLTTTNWMRHTILEFSLEPKCAESATYGGPR